MVEHVPTASWNEFSPCPDWSARQLLGHVIDGQQQIAGMLTEHSQPPVTDPAAFAQLAGTDPRARWHRSRDDVVAVLTSVDPSTTVMTPGGPSNASAVLSIVVIEPLVHAWDLAAASRTLAVFSPEWVGVDHTRPGGPDARAQDRRSDDRGMARRR